MSKRHRGRRAAAALVAAALLAAVIALAIVLTTHTSKPSRQRATASLPRNGQLLLVGRPAPVQPIRPGFLGLSFEYRSIEPYAGTDASAINPAFLQLIRNLTRGQTPVIRIGGRTTDAAWWPVPGMREPPGVRITLTPQWLGVTRTLARDLNARLILGVNMETNSQAVAAAEARAFLSGIGRRYIGALEPGNEPELYRTFTYYLAPDGSRVYGRPRDYNVPAIARDFTRIERVLPGPIAGPTIGAPKWFAQLGTFLADGPRLNLVTLHRYPLQVCFSNPSQSNYPTFAHLLDNQSSSGRADSVIPEVALAHARGLQLRIDEMNTISCGSDPRIGFSFATALWAVNALFAMADVGVDGVNIHSYPTSTCALYSFAEAGGTWRARVEPEYYGLLMFARAAPPGSRILKVSGPATADLRAWATRAPDGRIRVVLINDSATRAVTIAVHAGGQTTGSATLERLQAPSLNSNQGVTLGGQSFGASDTGQLSPHTTSIGRTNGDYHWETGLPVKTPQPHATAQPTAPVSALKSEISNFKLRPPPASRHP